MKIKLAIFDLDGTLFHNNEVNYCAYKTALEHHGFTLTEKQFQHFPGKSWTEFLPRHIRSSDWQLLQSIHALKQSLYSSYLHKAKPNTSLFEMIDAIREKYYIALVTTASRQNCMDILKYFKKDKLFEYILTREDVEKPKPNPEGYLTCMRHFHMPPANTIIFEDSPEGIAAATQSGAAVYQTIAFSDRVT